MKERLSPTTNEEEDEQPKDDDDWALTTKFKYVVYDDDCDT